jgi:hypothetical protein
MASTKTTVPTPYTQAVSSDAETSGCKRSYRICCFRQIQNQPLKKKSKIGITVPEGTHLLWLELFVLIIVYLINVTN